MKSSILCLIVIITYPELSTQINYPPIREADVMWSTRVWRELDLKQKINLPLYYPLNPSQGYQSLYDVLITAIIEDSLAAYGIGPLGLTDDFSIPLPPIEVSNIISKTDTVYTYDLDSDEMVPVPQTVNITSADITRYRIKEDWIFDRSRSQMIVRIIGIAPLREVRSDEGVVRGYTPLFWVHFDEARAHLASAPVYLRHNDNQDLNYDDLFVKRFFDGYVVKESNVYDRFIGQYSSGVDALLEGERVEEEIRNLESDLWSH